MLFNVFRPSAIYDLDERLHHQNSNGFLNGNSGDGEVVISNIVYVMPVIFYADSVIFFVDSVISLDFFAFDSDQQQMDFYHANHLYDKHYHLVLGFLNDFFLFFAANQNLVVRELLSGARVYQRGFLLLP